MGPTRQALRDAGLEAKDIDKVLLVGGSTRFPLYRKLLPELLNKEPFKALT